LRAAESRHAALRLRFEPDGAAHAVDECVINKPVLFNQRGLDAADRRAQEDRVAAECIGGIDITRGPLLAAALLDRGAHEPSVLLVAVHHLVFDAISWSILADDLTAALAGTALPAPGAGFDLWCHALRRHAEGLDAQRPLWRRIEAGIAPILPRLTSGRGANLERHVAREIIRLSPAETAACKQAAGSVGTAGLPEAVLTALAVSLRPWVSGPVVLDVEGHGREAIDPALEVERTIGWFTTHYPVMLDVDARDAPRAQLDQVRQAWRSLPESGLGYGILRHLRSAEGVGRDPDVSFNFLGNLETGTASPFERFGTAHERDPAAPRRYLLVVEAFTAGGALTIELLYPRGLVADEVIASIADGMADWFDRFAEPGALQSLPEELALSADDLQALNERLGL
jgi:non-ribosomal peptide synthase protein (TIGR01720 family)